MITIRPAKKDDFEFFYCLKSEDSNVFWSGGNDKPDKENLKCFFEKAIENSKKENERKIYIISNENEEKVGHLYFIPDGEEYDLACAVCEEFWGRGYAKHAIKLGLEEGKRLGFKRMVGSIREDNIASMKAYTSCGIKILDEYKEVYIPKLNENVKMFKAVYEYID